MEEVTEGKHDFSVENASCGPFPLTKTAFAADGRLGDFRWAHFLKNKPCDQRALSAEGSARNCRSWAKLPRRGRAWSAGARTKTDEDNGDHGQLAKEVPCATAVQGASRSGSRKRLPRRGHLLGSRVLESLD
jgi:hypothetical protein